MAVQNIDGYVFVGWRLIRYEICDKQHGCDEECDRHGDCVDVFAAFYVDVPVQFL